MINGYQRQIYTLLAADATLIALCTGGIYLYDDWPDEKGLSYDTAPQAYQDNKLLPTLQVRGRDVNNRPGAPDDPEEQLQFGVQVVEVYIQADQAVPFADLDPIKARVYTLLHERPEKFANFARLECDRLFRPFRDPALDHAPTYRVDFLIEGS